MFGDNASNPQMCDNPFHPIWGFARAKKTEEQTLNVPKNIQC